MSSPPRSTYSLVIARRVRVRRVRLCKNPEDIPQLNADVFSVIVNFLTNPNDICSFMKANRMTFAIGVPSLLFYVPICNQRSLKSFSEFLSSNLSLGSRGSCMRRLIIDLSVAEGDLPNCAALLTQILNVAENLEKLRISCSEQLLQADVALKSALLRLNLLRHLVLEKGGQETAAFLSDFKAPLKIVDVRFEDGAVRNLRDPISFLGGSSNSLWYLELGEIDISAFSVELPNVRYFKYRTFDPIRAASLMRVFPNLDEFHLFPVHDVLLAVRVSRENLRETNKEALSSLQQPWLYLNKLSGNAMTLYTLGISSCHVYDLSIYPNINMSTRRYYTLVGDIEHDWLTIILPACEFSRRLMQSLLTSLTTPRLHLKFDLQGTEWRYTLTFYLEHIVPILKQVNVEILIVEIQRSCMNMTSRWQKDEINGMIEGMDLKGLAAWMAQFPGPRLQVIGVNISAWSTGIRYWEVTREGKDEDGYNTEAEQEEWDQDQEQDKDQDQDQDQERERERERGTGLEEDASAEEEREGDQDQEEDQEEDQEVREEEEEDQEEERVIIRLEPMTAMTRMKYELKRR